ncbi:DUF1295-domain-containing protein [Fomitiporia mediterranea MF3/22]|uniref:DUF1295-domain-containing protein n=1 Tax=Fomitiporia mediterranea (strain MF3/22) TaxID=694068 RepID=UPI000440889B|nr:DUF1295-domain-containing protein [Fomitiporia mediterranea MF3/22]EJD06997.1 DUF1295-domain-containing protein [Fomitiporia mediterranea MF3/22]
MGIFSRLLPPLASAYGLQAIFALIFVPQKNERFYDLGGALGFLSTTFVSMYYPALRDKYVLGKNIPLPRLSSFAPRQLLLTGCLVLWSTRLGSFLVTRAMKTGGDSRFDKVKHQPGKFTFYWMAQAAWVFLVGLPVYLVNTLPPNLHPALGPRDYVALSLFASSFLFEIVADNQKSVWRREKNEKKHDESFITRGLWSISRHPNYVGEVGIWTGIWALSASSMQTPYFPKVAPLIAAASPIITYLLLRNVSGVPLLEKAGDKKFGDNPKWQEYKRNVPVFWPWGPVD